MISDSEVLERPNDLQVVARFCSKEDEGDFSGQGYFLENAAQLALRFPCLERLWFSGVQCL